MYAGIWFGFFVILAIVDDRLGYSSRGFSWRRF